MKLFKSFGKEFNYESILQLDGAFYRCHLAYEKEAIFHDTEDNIINSSLREDDGLLLEGTENLYKQVRNFDGTVKYFSKDEQKRIWKKYWMEYNYAFDKLIDILPNSIVTAFVGRQAVELGLKYLLLKKTDNIIKSHNLDELAKAVFAEYVVSDDYMKNIVTFCEYYCTYIEGDNVEYFRYPEYKNDAYFAGNMLDINWLSYNFALVVLKLLHFAGVEDTQDIV